MRVSCFTRYGSQAASTRQRLLQYIPSLREAGIEVANNSLLSDDYVRSIATGDTYSKREIAASYLRRIQQVRQNDADVIWIYAELFPYLPASFEKLAFKSGRPVVYDFDDAFFHLYDSSSNPFVRALLGGKLEPLLKGATACCCGNQYLLDYASRFCRNSIILPTVVDTSIYRPSEAKRDGRPVVLGWIGSPSTWPYVRPLLPMLSGLVREFGVQVQIVGAGAGAERDGFPGMKFIDWTEQTEVEQVQAMDIGMMPVPDEDWARGKSGYKLVQYMACGLPVVASPVGVNQQIVKAGENGFLASTPHEWKIALSRLIRHQHERERLGTNGRRWISTDYSLEVHSTRLVGLLNRVVQL